MLIILLCMLYYHGVYASYFRTFPHLVTHFLVLSYDRASGTGFSQPVTNVILTCSHTLELIKRFCMPKIESLQVLNQVKYRIVYYGLLNDYQHKKNADEVE